MTDNKKSSKYNVLEATADRTPHYGFRKLSAGLASVLLSTTLWVGNQGQAHAATGSAEANGSEGENESQEKNAVATSSGVVVQKSDSSDASSQTSAQANTQEVEEKQASDGQAEAQDQTDSQSATVQAASADNSSSTTITSNANSNNSSDTAGDAEKSQSVEKDSAKAEFNANVDAGAGANVGDAAQEKAADTGKLDQTKQTTDQKEVSKSLDIASEKLTEAANTAVESEKSEANIATDTANAANQTVTFNPSLANGAFAEVSLASLAEPASETTTTTFNTLNSAAKAAANAKMLSVSLAAASATKGSHAERSSSSVPYYFEKYTASTTDGVSGKFTPKTATTGSYSGYFHASFKNYANVVVKVTFDYAYNASKNTFSITNMTLGYSKDPTKQGGGFNDAIAILTSSASLPKSYAKALPSATSPDVAGATPKSIASSVYSDASSSGILGLFVQNNKTDESTWTAKPHNYTVSADKNGNFKIFQVAKRSLGWKKDGAPYDGAYWDYFSIDLGVKQDTIKETVNYVVKGGSVAAPVSKVQTVKILKIGNNPTGSKIFSAVTTPSLKGYKADVATVAAKTVKYGDADTVVTVTYTPDNQIVHITYHDDTDNKDLKSDTLNGESDTVAYTSEGGWHPYTTGASINTYKGQGYVLVSDSTNGQQIMLDHVTGTDQYFTVHLKHGTYTKDVTDDVARTVEYRITGGKHQVPSPVNDSLHFTGKQTIDSVNQKVLKTDWSANHDFKDVNTPEIQGYTPDRKVVSNKNIAHDAADINVVVTYTPETQNVYVIYHDDTDNKDLKQDKMWGDSNSTVGMDSGSGWHAYTTGDSIKDYQSKGYVLVSDDTGGNQLTFDSDSSKDQYFTVHLKHGTYTKDVTDDVARTVEYKIVGGKHQAPSPVNDSLHFTGKQTIDSVNQKVLKTDWSANQDFKDVNTPEIQGYTPDRKVVSNKNIAHDAADIHELVTYKADNQVVHITYHDDTTGKDLKSDTLNGESDTTVYTSEGGWHPYTTTANIKDYQSKGYVLVSDNTGGKQITFDHVTGTDQYFVVHLKHDTKTPVEKRHYATVTRTITYKMSDGSKAPSGVSDSLTFTAQDTVDAVTGAVVSTTWSGNQNFSDVTSPVIAGYTADKKTVSNKGIAHDHANITEIVTYTPDAQKATVTYIDGTTGKTLKADSLSGVTNAKSGYTTTGTIATYKGLGYALASDPTNGKEIVFDANDSENQSYTVTLVHTYQTVTNTDNIQVGTPINSGAGSAKWPSGTNKASLEDSVNRTINYVVTGGKKTAPASAHDTLNYTATKTVDKVTGEIVASSWSSDQNFRDVTSPALKGYTPNRSIVSNTGIGHDHADIVETVTYSPNTQKATVTYLDQTTGKQLKLDTLTGLTLESSGYTTASAIKGYTDNGYALVSDSTNGNTIVFDDDDSAAQAYTVVLKHTYITVTPTNPGAPGSPMNADKNGTKYPSGTDAGSLKDSVTRTVNYVVKGGKKQAPSSVTNTLNYTASKTIDRVTGEITQTSWSGNQDFADVNTPALKGYTADRATVSNKNIAHDHADITETVAYNPDAQKATVTYIDQTTGKQLKLDTLTGLTLESSGYTTASAIKGYTDNGYALVSDSTNGSAIVFDDDDAATQAYTIVLKHTYITVTPTNPGTPGSPMNADKNGTKYPSGTDAGSLKDSVTRTVNYVVKGGKKQAPSSVTNTLNYTASKIIDRVTGEITQTSWSGNQDFTEVKTPALKGYTPDRFAVSNQNIAHDHADITETVTYNPDAQKATVTYVDQTTGKQLKLDTLTGLTYEDSGYTTAATIKSYTDNGYALVSDNTNGNEIFFDDDDAATQAYTVVLKHTYITVTPEKPGTPGSPMNADKNGTKYPSGTDAGSLKDSVTRTVNYVVKGGKKQAPSSVTNTLNYTASKTIDRVTGEITQTSWSGNQDFADVNTPVLQGYTPDKTVVSNKGIAHDHADITETVTYNPDAQKATVTYIDQTTGKQLKLDTLTGLTLENSGYTTASAIKGYTDNGYALVSDSTNGSAIVFDDDDAATQAYTIVLKHTYITVTPTNPGTPGSPMNADKNGTKYPGGTEKAGLTDSVNRTITYVVVGRKDAAPAARKDTLNYTASKTIDRVTGEITQTSWSGNQDFADVNTPALQGYTPDKTVVSNKGIAHDAQDIDVVVTYNPDAQKASVIYIDSTTGQQLKNDELSGFTHADSGYTTAATIKKYQDLGYALVSDETNGKSIVFDNDDAANQTYKVTLKHTYVTITNENPQTPGTAINPGEGSAVYPDGVNKAGLNETVNRTINYVVANGKKPAPASVQDALNYTAAKVVDKVTGALISVAWSENQNFTDIASPALKGYTPSQQTVSNKNIAYDHADIVETVTYNPDAQKATVTYIDQTTGRQLKLDTLTGLTLENSGYTTASTIKSFTDNGYALVSDNTNGQEIVFDDDDAATQAYTIVLKHTYITVTPENPGTPGSPINADKNGVRYPDGTDAGSLKDSVTRTVNYVVKGGKKQAPSSVTNTLNYTASKTIDRVTGEITQTSWSGNQDFADVNTPALKGYTADRATVSNKGIAHDHADITETVTYNPDAQKATVTYVDQTTGKQLKLDTLTGLTLENSRYTTAATIKNFTDNGYALVSDNTNGQEIVFDDDDAATQAYTVVLKHTYITVTPTNPGTPGSPINADKNGVKYPDGTDKAGLTNSVTRTVNYVVANGRKPAPNSVKDTLNYTASKIIDRVTGEVTQTSWSGNQDFTDVKTPALKGYTPDRFAVSNQNIAHDHADITETVTYNPDAQKATITYVDQTTGKQLKLDTLTGLTLENSGYTTAATIKSYTDNGYALVSDNTNGQEIVFDDDDAATQAYTIVLKHTYIAVTPEKPGTPGSPINADKNGVKYPDGTDKAGLTDTVNRTVTYVIKGGNRTAPASVKDTLNYTASKTIDRVTGEVTETVWSPNQDFKDVNTPELQGYTPDRKVVSNKNIAHDAADISELVTYKADNQVVHITYHDDTSGEDLKMLTLNGESDTIVYTSEGGWHPYTSADDIAYYQNNGYALVSDDTNGKQLTFDHVTGTDQYFTLHFKHTYTTVTEDKPGKPGQAINKDQNGAKYPDGTDKASLGRDVNRTINYTMSDGSKAPEAVKDKLHFTLVKTIDNTTGKVVKAVWSDNQDFKDIASPAVKGYTVDRATVSNTDIPYSSDDITENVTYTPDKQNGKVTYVDQTTGKALKVDNLSGVTSGKSGYTTAKEIAALESNGYELVSDDTNGKEIVFDNDDDKDQAYTVTLKHTYATVTEENPATPGTAINKDLNGAKYPDGTDKASLGRDVRRTITYRMSDGSQAPGPVDSVLHFTATKVVDKVTGEVISTSWSPAQDYDDVESPAVKGYTVDQKVISNKGITHEHSDIHEIVTYDPDAQNGKVTYVDDTTGQIISVKELSGKSNGHSGYTTAAEIAALEVKGYVLVSDDTNGQEVVFDDKDSSDQNYTVKLAHRIDNSTEDHTATRTIRLHEPGGLKTIKQVGHVIRSVKTDAVTGQKTYGEWSKDKWDEFDTPEIKGYTASLDKVLKEIVDGDTKDKVVDIYYKKKEAPVSSKEEPKKEEPKQAEPAPTPAPTPQASLPQTGNKDSILMQSAGMFATGASLLATVINRKKKSEE